MKNNNRSKKVEKDQDLQGYPLYPSNEDLYNRATEETEIDTANVRKRKSKNMEREELNEKDFEQDMTAEDLDIPGNEDDESSMGAGGEDEENNYYSLGDNG